MMGVLLLKLYLICSKVDGAISNWLHVQSKNFLKIVFACCFYINYVNFMGEASPGGKPNVNIDPHVGLNRQRHSPREGMERAWQERHEKKIVDFLAMKDSLFHS